MLRRHALPLILVAAAASVAGCSPSNSGNITATDNESAAALTNDVLANDETALPDDSAPGNALLTDNVTTPSLSNAN